MCIMCGDDPDPNTCAYASTCCVCGKKFFGYGYNATDYMCDECREEHQCTSARCDECDQRSRERSVIEKWVVGEPGGPNGPFYSVVAQNGRVIAMRVPDETIANTISQIPYLMNLRYEWALVIDCLAKMVLDIGTSRDNDFAEKAAAMVRPVLFGEQAGED